MQADEVSAVLKIKNVRGLHARAAAAEAYLEKETPTVVLATAHPSKFPVPVREATGITPSLPSRLSDLLTRKEVFTVLPNSLDAVKYFIQTHVRKG